MKPVGVMYGTEFGLSREVAEKLADELIKTGEFWPIVMDMDDYPRGLCLKKFQAFCVTCSTQGEGIPPTGARPFFSWLHGPDSPNLASLVYSVCALGDTSYTHFAKCGKDIDARLEALGAKRIAARVDVNKEDWKAIDGWIASILENLKNLKLKTISESEGLMTSVATDLSGDAAEGCSKSRPCLATISHVSNLCRSNDNLKSDDKHTVRVDIELSDSEIIEYIPGDSLGIWPKNDPIAVEELLVLMGWDGDNTIVKKPSWHYKDPRFNSNSDEDNNMTLKDALLDCYDLKSPKPEILNLLAEHGGCDERIKSLMADDALKSKYLDERHIIDILEDFSPSKGKHWIDPDVVLKMLRQLAPRMYSISSSPLENPKKVTLTVAVVEYQLLGKERIGVCSTFLGNRLSDGSQIAAYMYTNPDFRLPENNETPIIMVGPGTGVAPFRAFLQQRIISCPDTSMEKNILFFGSRKRNQDFLYGDEFEAWKKEGKLNLITAFSREQERKIYVQDRLKEHGGMIWQLLEQGAHFYICGDGENMAGAVETCLLNIISSHGCLEKAAAAEYLKNLTETHRFQKDVWIS